MLMVRRISLLPVDAPIVCEPAVDAGATNVPVNAPAESVTIDAGVVVAFAPSYVMVTAELGAKFAPVTVTVDPTLAVGGLNVIDELVSTKFAEAVLVPESDAWIWWVPGVAAGMVTTPLK